MHRAHPRLRRSVHRLVLCLLLIGIASAAHAEKPLELVLYTPLNVDGSATTATTTLQLHNPNPGPLNYILAIQNAKAKNTNMAADWVVTFYGADNKPAGPVLEGNLAPGRSISIRVDLAHVVEAGETTAELLCNSVKIADLRLVKDQGLPFRVSLEGNPSEKPEIEFVKGSPLDMRWKNDDAMTYPLSWEFFLKGKSVTGTTQIGPNGSTKFTVVPDNGWFSLYQSFFKSETVDGSLTVGYKPQGAVGAYPSKTIPIKVRLTYSSSWFYELLAMGVIILVLALGGFASVYVNVDLVNRIKAISITKRLGQLARVIGETGPRLNSPLLVSLWLERGRIEATLPQSILFTPEIAAVLSQSDADTEALKVRVDLGAMISDICVRLDHAQNDGTIAPSLAELVDKDLSAAQDLLKKSVLSAGELQRVQSLVGAATNILDHVGEPDDDLEKTLDARLKDLKAQFTPAFLSNPTCVKIKKQVPIPFGLLDASASHLGSQSERDANTRKLAAIADMVRLHSTDADILQYLGRQEFVSLEQAEQLITELKSGVSLKDLSAEIGASPPEVYFKMDRETVRVNTPIMMRVMFNKQHYNRAAARRRILCTWSIDGDHLTEKGWEIYHYFPEAKLYKIAVRFKDINQVDIPSLTPIEQDVTVVKQREGRRDPRRVEFQRWAVGFLVALISLFAGAKEKILSLDTLGAIFAVFLLGFGIDMAKNLLVPKVNG